MDALSATNPMGPEMYALRQSTKVQEEEMAKLLEISSSFTPMESSTKQVSGLAQEGIGANLDLQA